MIWEVDEKLDDVINEPVDEEEDETTALWGSLETEKKKFMVKISIGFNRNKKIVAKCFKIELEQKKEYF